VENIFFKVAMWVPRCRLKGESEAAKFF
jgi:hypothetical protein